MRHDRKTRRVAMAGLAAGACALAAVSVVSPASAQTSSILAAANPVEGSYIVVLKDGDANAPQVNNKAFDLAKQYGGSISATYTATLRGFAVKLDEAAAKRLAANPAVAYVQQDGVATIQDVQQNATWGLDRIDQRDLPLDSQYEYANDGSGATVYVLDTGVDMDHPEFEGRATSGYDFIDNDSDASDCQGHGTHVAGTVGSRTWGVAKKVDIVSVRVLNCQGSGQYSQIIDGMDWVARNAGGASVVNMSLGGGGSSTVDNAVERLVDAGVTTVVASGNASTDACGTSPARAPEAITVNSTDSRDNRSSFSNYGRCTDIFAPGSSITSTRNGGGSHQLSGTSMATPHVAGASALYLTANPNSTPQQVRDALVDNGTQGVVNNPGSGSTNSLLYTGFIDGDDPGPDPGCSGGTNGDNVSIPDNGDEVSSTITVSGCSGNGSANTQVKVTINHSYVGDLVLDLQGPSGEYYNLKKAGGGKGDGSLNETYTVDVSGEARNGDWKLLIADVWRYDAGTLDTWSITP